MITKTITLILNRWRGSVSRTAQIWIIAFSATVLVLINGNLMAGAGHCWIKIEQAAIFNKYQCALRAEIHGNELLSDRGLVGREISRKSRGRHRQGLRKKSLRLGLYFIHFRWIITRQNDQFHGTYFMRWAIDSRQWWGSLVVKWCEVLFRGLTTRNDLGRVGTINYAPVLRNKNPVHNEGRKLVVQDLPTESTGFAHLHWINARTNVHHSCR